MSFADGVERLRADPAAPKPAKDLIPKLSPLLRWGKRMQPKINDAVARASKVGNPPFFDAAQWPFVARLEAEWETIRAEADAVLTDLNAVPPLAEISPDHRRIAPAGRWRSFFLHGYGYRIEENCRKCPRTAELLKSVPGLNTALFSVLVPGTHIPPHTGVTKAILVCHLGLRVPQARERCQIRVGDQYRAWEEGRAFVFDDMYDHEVLNDTEETRVVLLVQFRRPARLWGRVLGEAFLWGVRHSRFVQDARKGAQRWAERG